jgi:predicted nucleic acid-binding protein
VASYYLDTSALDKRYAQEVGTAGMLVLTDPAQAHALYTIRLTGPQMIAALFRKVRIGQISQADATRAAANFRVDWRYQYQIIEIQADLAERAMELAENHGLRGYDAVHLAAALELHSARVLRQLSLLTFVSADDEQLRVAQAEGLQVDNPNNNG